MTWCWPLPNTPKVLLVFGAKSVYLGCFVFLVSAFLHGCGTTPLQIERVISQEKTQGILERLKARAERIHRLKGLFRVAITGSILPISRTIPGVVFYKRPDSIRLKGLTPVGGTFFQFVRDGEDYRLLIPGNGQSSKGKIHELNRAGDMGQVVELSLRALDAVLGKFERLSSGEARVFEENEAFRIDIPSDLDQRADKKPFILTRLRVDKIRLNIVQIEYLDQGGDVVRSIDCQDFRVVSAQSQTKELPIHLPFHIHAEDDQLSGSVTLDFQELVANAT